MSLKTLVGIRVREFRRAKKLTQEELARLTDRSVDAISALERGLVLPGFDTLERLATALGMPLTNFLDGVEGNEPTRRTRLRARLTAVAETLSDDQLEIAVNQIAVLAGSARSASDAGR